jgi:hypothetical protein
MTWIQPLAVGDTPAPRYGHASLSIGNKIVIGAGSGVTQDLTDVCVLDTTSLQWKQLDVHGGYGCSYHSMSYLKGRLYMYGSKGTSEVLSLDLSTFAIFKEHSIAQAVEIIRSNLDRMRELIANLSGGKPRVRSRGRMCVCVCVCVRANACKVRGSSESASELLEEILRNSTGTFNEFKFQFSKLTEEEELFQHSLAEQTEALQRQRERLEQEKQLLGKISFDREKKIIVNVGGSRFETTIVTLTKDFDSMLATMFSGRFPLHKDEVDASYFIDRDGTHFRYVLNYLRGGSNHHLPSNREVLEELLAEAEFYQLQGLVLAIKAKLKQ